MAVEISPQQFRICQEANGQFFTIHTPFQLLANPPSCITTLYAKHTASISTRCSLQIRKSSDVSMPSQLAPDVWILTTTPSTVTTTITLICLGEKNKIHSSKETHSCIATTHSLQCYITTFPSTPTVWNYIFRSKYIFGYGKSPHDQHFITGLAHMAALGKARE